MFADQGTAIISGSPRELTGKSMTYVYPKRGRLPAA